MATIKATDKTSNRSYAATLPIPGTSEPMFDTFMGGVVNVRELALGAFVVRVQARLRDMAKTGVNKTTGKPWTVAEQQAAAEDVLADVKAGPRHKSDPVDKALAMLLKMTPEQRAAALKRAEQASKLAGGKE